MNGWITDRRPTAEDATDTGDPDPDGRGKQSWNTVYRRQIQSIHDPGAWPPKETQ